MADAVERVAMFYVKRIRIFEASAEHIRVVAAGEHPIITPDWLNDDFSVLSTIDAEYAEDIDIKLLHAIGGHLTFKYPRTKVLEIGDSTGVSGVRPSILFYNADEIFAHVVTSELEAIQLQHQFATSLTGAPAEWIKVHLLASHRAMQRAIPHDTTVFVDCSDITDSLAAAFVASIPAICTTYRVGSGLMSTALETAKFSGVCNAAMVLKDGFFIDMDADQLNNTLAAEVLGTEQLDSIFHDTNLDFFICLVSVASVIGNVASIIHIAYVTDVGYVTREQRGRQLDSHFRKVRLMPTSKMDVHHAFMEALSTTAYPHEALRTCFFTRAGDRQPWQGVLASPRVELNHVSVEENATVGADVKRLSSRSWDLEEETHLNLV
ncbi:unnamed protein product [Fusarium graminearum]|nr:hypothetical protein FG05_13879 [Fusarium graminearum]CZS85573.1 unnamed protein product [Fusarium graminearum]